MDGSRTDDKIIRDYNDSLREYRVNQAKNNIEKIKKILIKFEDIINSAFFEYIADENIKIGIIKSRDKQLEMIDNLNKVIETNGEFKIWNFQKLKRNLKSHQIKEFVIIVNMMTNRSVNVLLNGDFIQHASILLGMH